MIEDLFLCHEADVTLGWKSGSSDNCEIEIPDVIHAKDCATFAWQILNTLEFKLKTEIFPESLNRNDDWRVDNLSHEEVPSSLALA